MQFILRHCSNRRMMVILRSFYSALISTFDSRQSNLYYLLGLLSHCLSWSSPIQSVISSVASCSWRSLAILWWKDPCEWSRCGSRIHSMRCDSLSHALFLSSIDCRQSQMRQVLLVVCCRNHVRVILESLCWTCLQSREANVHRLQVEPIECYDVVAASLIERNSRSLMIVDARIVQCTRYSFLRSQSLFVRSIFRENFIRKSQRERERECCFSNLLVWERSSRDPIGRHSRFLVCKYRSNPRSTASEWNAGNCFRWGIPWVVHAHSARNSL